MKFPGRRRHKHYFPVEDKDPLTQKLISTNSLQRSYIVGIDQIVVDIEAKVDNDFIAKFGLHRGMSQVIDDETTNALYQELQDKDLVNYEFAGGTIGNTMHNYSVLSDDRSVLLGVMSENIKIGSYAYRFISNTSSRVDLEYLQGVDGPIGRCFTLIDESEFIILDSSDINSWVTIMLNDSVLSSGNIYLAAVRGKQESFNSRISSASNSNSLTFLQDNGCNLGQYGFGAWYTLSHSLLIRLNIGWDTLLTSYDNIIIENDLTVYPNPTKGIFSINLDGQNSCKLTVRNIVGQIIYKDYVPGGYVKNIDLSNHKSGVYLLELDTDNGIVNKKLILQ